MEINPASKRLYSLIVLFDMQSTFFSSAIDGISDKDAHNRLNTKANHVAWLTGTLVQQRFDMADGLKSPPELLQQRKAAPELFSNHQGIKDEIAYPSLALFKKDWELITPDLRNRLLQVTEKELNAPTDMPGMEMRLYDLLAFCIYREANCIGQIALWRRLLGYDPMKYM